MKMNEKETKEILDYIANKYNENVPRAVRVLAKGKINKIKKFSAEELPASLRQCTVEELLQIVQTGMTEGKLKL